jgi:hypothetical protein
MCDDVTKGEMPEWQYLIMHRQAKLSSADIQAVCAWSKAASASLAQ